MNSTTAKGGGRTFINLFGTIYDDLTYYHLSSMSVVNLSVENLGNVSDIALN